MSNGFSIRISAVDNATKSIDAINKRLASLRAPVDRFNQSIAKFSNVSGITKMRQGFEGLARSVFGAATSLARVVPAMGALTGAASLAGMGQLVSHWADFGAQLQNTSRRLGMSTTALHGMQNAARLAGAGGTSLTDGLRSLGDAMQDAVAGRAPEAMRLFQLLGMEIHASSFEARSAGDIMPQLADRIASIRNPAIQAALATRLFGSAGEALLPYLRRGAAGMREYEDRARRYGLMNAEGARQADRLREAQTTLALSVEGLGNSIAEKLGPILGPLLTQFADWIATNREIIATRIGEYVKRFADWLKELDFGAVVQGMRDFWHTIDDTVKSMGGWETVSKVIFGLWAASKVAPLVAGIGLAASAVGGLSAAVGSLVGFLPALGTLAPLLGPVAAIGAAFLGINELQHFRRTPQQQEQQRSNWRDRGAAAPPAAAPTGERASRENAIYDGLLARGVSAAEAAGITSNAMRESGGDPAAFNPAGGGQGANGIFQWRGDRARLPDGRNVRDGTLEEQLDHFMRERGGREAGAVARAGQGAQDAGDWGAGYSQHFERHGNTNEDAARGQLALQIERRQAARRMATPPATTAGTPAPLGVNAVTQPPQLPRDVSGNINVGVTVNAPPGTQVQAQSSGNAFNDPPRIAMGMPMQPGQ